MNGSCAAAPGWWLHLAAAGGLLLLVGWALMCRVRQPARRQWLGEWTLMAALLVAVFGRVPAWLTLPWRLPSVYADRVAAAVTPPGHPTATEERPQVPGRDGPENAVRSEETAAPAAAIPADLLPDARPLAATEPDSAVTAAVAPPGQPRAAGAGDPPPTAAPTFPWLSWLGWAYAAGALFFTGRWLVGYCVLRRLLRRAVAAPGPVRQLFQAMVRDMAPTPRLLASRDLRAPVSCGLWQPTVLLPVALCHTPAVAELRCVFAHELTHLRRRDAWSCLLFAAGQAAFFFLPWFWWLRRQVRLCQEYIADAAGAREASRPEDYAQFLVTMSSRPAVLVGATGVSGSSSDLYRRVTMLLQDPVHVEGRSPRLWSLAAAVGLVGLAWLVSGIGLRADVGPNPAGGNEASATADNPSPDRKAEPERADKKKGEEAPPAVPPDIEALRRALQNLPPGADPEEVQKGINRLLERKKEINQLLERNRSQVDQMLQEQEKALRELTRAQRDFGRLSGLRRGRGEGRLGVHLAAPDATLADQLDLPRGEGLVVEQVQPGSPAAKAGLKVNDILVQLDGKAVPSDVMGFARMLKNVKADTPVDVVVVRKGKKETVKGLSLPEAKGEAGRFGLPGLVPGVPLNAVPGGGVRIFAGGAAGNGVITTVVRQGEHFTARQQEGRRTLTVTGTLSDGKANVSQVQVQDGTENNTYEGVDQVPEKYQDKVKSLVDMSEKNHVRSDSRAP